MTARIDLARVAPQQKAELIYNQARSDLASRLWRAALGDAGGPLERDSFISQAASEGGLDALLALIGANGLDAAKPKAAPPVPTAAASLPALPPQDAKSNSVPLTAASSPAAGLGANERHRSSLEAAGRRTGIPVAALTAIVDAEAAKGRDGSWKLLSRNPRSSAAGLGQFLSGTWIGEAERPGTWLNATARARGWLTEAGKVASSARSELLALRYDGDASINATADYARANLDRLRRSGVSIESTVEATAHAAYLGHHLGVGDAIKFLKDGLGSSRARTLLHAQIGSASAERRIAEAGSATGAHRAWLLSFVGRHVRPDRFQSMG